MTIQEFKEKITSPLIWGNLLAMVLVTIGVIVGVLYWLDSYTHHGEEISVPDATNLKYDDAFQVMEQEGLYAIIADSTYEPKRPVGVVISQHPAPGSMVKLGREIYLTINRKNCPTRALPDLIDNCSLREAQDRLKQLGFKLGPVETAAGDKDWVLGMKCDGRNVYANDRVPIESSITLVVGQGNNDDDDWDDDEEMTSEEQIEKEITEGW